MSDGGSPTYAATLGGGTAFGFLVFASYANRLPVCDALSPVWLSDALARRRHYCWAYPLSPGRWKRGSDWRRWRDWPSPCFMP